MLHDAYLKLGFRVVKTGSGNYIVNPANFKTKSENSIVFEFKSQQADCIYCNQTMPDQETLRDILEAIVLTNGENEVLEYH